MKHIITTFLFLLTASYAFALKPSPQTQPFTGIAGSVNIVTTNGPSGYENANTVITDRRHKILLSLNELSSALPAFTFKVAVSLKIYKGTTLKLTQTKTLTINYNPETNHTSNAVYEIGYDPITDGEKFEATVTTVTNPQSIPLSNFSLSIEQQVEYHYLSTYIIDNPVLTPTSAINAPNGEFTISWNAPLWAEGYDLEYFYINDYSETGGDLADALIKIDQRAFQFNSTRIHTKKSNYSFPLLHDKGYILYRVRGYARTPVGDGTYIDIAQSWTEEPPYSTVGSFVGKRQIKDVDRHDVNLNWQASTTFAEEGKSKTVVSYFDGSLRSRQEVTQLSTPYNEGVLKKKPIIIGETVYDHEGRPALKILPVPMAGEKISFYSGFNKNMAGQAFSKLDFDVSTGGCGVSTSPLNTNSGASQYYSPSNEFLGLTGEEVARQAQFIPDAFRYPIVQTRYTRDNTGRVSAQSAPGQTFQLGSGKETKYFYGRPDQIELDRLFGSDAGYALHYKKSMVSDANGQLSISYMDLQGKVVATSLIGASPLSVSPLSTMDAEVAMNVDLFNKTYATDRTGAENKIDTVKKTKTFGYDFLVGKREVRNFYYELRNNRYDPGCLDTEHPTAGVVSPKPNTDISSLSFTTHTAYPLSLVPVYSTKGDINNDTYEDVIVLTSTDKIIVYRNNISEAKIIGASSFEKTVFTAETDMKQVVVEDLDNDGLKEIVVLTPTEVIVYKNISEGSSIKFVKDYTYSGSLLSRIAIADINDDGFSDICVASNESTNQRIIVLRNIIQTTFNTTLISFDDSYVKATGFNQSAIAVTDFDNDGKDDIVVSNNTSFQLKVFKNETTTPATILFAGGITLTMPSGTTAINDLALGDLNKDGRSEIVAALSGTKAIVFFENTSTSAALSFASVKDIMPAGSFYSLSLADVNKDGFIDIGGASTSEFYIVQVGVGLAFFTKVKVISAVTYDLKGVAFMDGDHDGKSDLIAVNASTSTSELFFKQNVISGIPACYECVLDITIGLKAKDQCEVEHLSGLNSTTKLTSVTVGPLESITNNPDFFPLHNCPETQTVFKRGKANNGVGSLWSTNILTGGSVLEDKILETGSYSLTKTLTVNQKALDIYTDNYINNNACLKSLTAFEIEEMEKLDFSLCDITCQERLAKLGANWATSEYNVAVTPSIQCKPCLTETQYTELKSQYIEECESVELSKCEAELMMMKADMSPSGQYGQIYDNVQVSGDDIPGVVSAPQIVPERFDLSVFNTYNKLPQKVQYASFYATKYAKLYPDAVYSREWIPNWHYPIRLTSTLLSVTGDAVESDFCYLDENGQIDYIILKYGVDGKLTPAVKEEYTQYIIKDGGVIKVKPQFLRDVKDFIAYWKPSWAQSLVAYHPEYGYYLLCSQNAVSNAWDQKLMSFENAYDIEILDEEGAGTGTYIRGANYSFVDGTSSHYYDWRGGDLSTNALKIEAAKRIIGDGDPLAPGYNAQKGMDPYFKGNTLLPGEYQTMLNRMVSYATDGSASISIWELAHRMVHCPTESLSPGKCSSCAYSTLANSTGKPIPATDADIADAEWQAFRGLYLSLKQEVMKVHATKVSIQDGYYNGCITDNAFSSTKDNFLHTYYSIPVPPPTTVLNYFPWITPGTVFPLSWPPYYSALTRPQSQYYNPEQTCNASRHFYYKGKRARFPQISEMVNTEDLQWVPCDVPNGFDEFSLPYCSDKVSKVMEKAKRLSDTYQNEKCKQCPVAAEFMGLLNDIKDKSEFSDKESTTRFDILKCGSTIHSGYTDALGEKITGAPAAEIEWIEFEQRMIPGDAETPAIFEATFKYQTEGAGEDQKTFKIYFPDLEYNITDITNFCCLQGKQNYLGEFDFTFTATVPMKPGDEGYIAQLNLHPNARPQVKQIILNAWSDGIDLTNCLPTLDCKTSEMAHSLENLFNGLLYRKPLVSLPPGAGVIKTPAFLGSTSASTINFTTLNSESSSDYWVGTFTDNIKNVLTRDETTLNLNGDVYWVAVHSSNNVKAYFYNNTNDLSGTPLTFTKLAALDATFIEFVLDPSSAYSFDKIISVHNITGSDNTFEMWGLVPTGGTNYTYVKITGYSNHFKFGKCSNRLFGNDESGITMQASAITAPAPARDNKNSLPDFVPEVTASDSDCISSCMYTLSTGDCWRTGFANINQRLRQKVRTPDDVAGHIRKGTYRLAFPQFIDPDFGGPACTDCSFEITSTTFDLADVGEIIGTSRVMGSKTKFFVTVRLKGSGQITTIQGALLNLDPNGNPTMGLGCPFPPRGPSGGQGQDDNCITCGNVMPAVHNFGRNYNYTQPNGAALEWYKPETRPFETELSGDYAVDEIGREIIPIRNVETDDESFGLLGVNKYGILYVSQPKVFPCKNPYGLIFKLNPSATEAPEFTYTSIWKTISTLPLKNTATVTPKKDYTFSFFAKREFDISAPSAEEEFVVKVKINGAEVDITRASKISNTGRFVQIIWNSGSNTEADIEILFANIGSSANVYSLSAIELEPDCRPIQCCPIEEKPLLVESPCKQSLRVIAQNNAKTRYESYIKNIRTQFENNYVAECLNVYEDFFMRYNNNEGHYTLYFYDQAGNLVRTIPPAGVKPFNLVSDATLLTKVKEDRSKGIKTVYTRHEMATTYRYNSLNQLQYQSTPDQVDLNIFKSEQLEALIPAEQVMNDMQFVNQQTGFAVGQIDSKGRLYKTNDRGNSWTEINSLGIHDINDVIEVVYNSPIVKRYYAVGKGGVLLEYNPNDVSPKWAIKQLPTKEELLRIIPIITSTTAELWVYTTSGTAFYRNLYSTTDSWSQPITTLKDILKGELSDVSFKPSHVGMTADGSELIGFAVSKNGKIATTGNGGAIWQNTGTNNMYLTANTVGGVLPELLPALHIWDGKNAYLAGVNGVMLKGKVVSDNVAEPASWSFVPTNISGDIKEIYFTSEKSGNALSYGSLYYTADGASAFSLQLSNIVDFYFIDKVTGYAVNVMGVVYKTTNGGKTWSLVSTMATSPTTISAINYTNSGVAGTYVVLGTAASGLHVYNSVSNSWVSFTMNISGALTKDVKMINIHNTAAAGLTPALAVSVLVSDGSLFYLSNIIGATSATAWTGSSANASALSFISTKDGYSFFGNVLNKTANGGATWTSAGMYTETNAAISAYHITASNIAGVTFSNASTAIVTTKNGYIFATEKAHVSAAKWEDQTTKLNAPFLNTVKMATTQVTIGGVSVNKDFVCIGGPSGAWIYKDLSSANRSWQLRSTGIKGNINKIGINYYSAEDDAYAVGDKGLVIQLNASSGVLTFYKSAANISPRNLRAISFDNSGNMTIGGDNATLLRGSSPNIMTPPYTTYTWTSATVNNITEDFTAIGLLGTSYYAVGKNGAMAIRNSSNANIWDRTSVLDAAPLKSICMVNGDIGYAAGLDGQVFKTSDKGATWVLQTGIPNTVEIYAIDFITDQLGLAAGKDGKVYKTINGGTAWTLLTGTGTKHLYDVKWLNSSVALIAGQDKTLLVTVNGGTSWGLPTTYSAMVGTLPSGDFFSIHFPDETVCYISGSNGTLLKVDNFGTSSQACIKLPSATVASPYVTPANNLRRIYFRDRLIGYAFGDNKKVYKTVDGGANWKELVLDGVTNNFTALGVIDDYNYVIGGVSGSTQYVSKMYDFTNEFSSRFYYDKLGRMVASQNAKQYAANPYRYSYTQYDYKGRITEVGEIDARSPIEATSLENSTDKTILNFSDGNWDLSKWVLGANVQKHIIGGNLEIAGTNRYEGADYKFNTIPGKVYRVRYKVASSSMEFYNVNVWSEPWSWTNNAASHSSYAGQNGLHREFVFTATQVQSLITIQKGWSVGATTPMQSITFEYLSVEELASPFAYYTCTELKLLKQYWTYSGSALAGLTDTAALATALRYKYWPQQNGGDIQNAFTLCEASNGVVSKVLAGVVRPSTVSSTLNNTYYEEWLDYYKMYKKDITRTYYDEAALDANLPLDFNQQNLRNRVASTTVSAAFSNQALPAYNHAMHYSYDIHGNVGELLIENSSLKTVGAVSAPSVDLSEDQQFKLIQYEYDLISGKVNKVAYQKGKADQFFHQYVYDADNKITRVETSADGLIWELDAKYFYYLHGPLARTEIGHDQIQGMDYAYTMQGWLKVVNSSSLATESLDMGRDNENTSTSSTQRFARDEMGYSLGYFANDYQPIGGGVQGVNNPAMATAGSDLLIDGSTSRALYNGNISHMITTIRQFGWQTGSSYKYDQLNRLAQAQYHWNVDVANNQWGSGQPAMEDNLNTFTYDANGNILTQKRNGDFVNNKDLDNLTYEYYPGTNKLKRVSDIVASSNYPDDIDNQVNAENYKYDEIGNLIQDKAEEIDAIEWTVYGKIKSIKRIATSTKPDLYFEYGPDGNRVVKTVIPKGYNKFPVSTYYVRDAQGNVMATYERTLEKGVNFSALTYSEVNNKIVALQGNEVWGYVSGTVNADRTAMLNHALTDAQTLTDVQKKNIILSWPNPNSYLVDHPETNNRVFLNFPTQDYIHRYFNYSGASDLTPYINGLCECRSGYNTEPAVAHMLRNHASRKGIFKGMYYSSYGSQYVQILINLGLYSGNLENDLNSIEHYGVDANGVISEASFTLLMDEFEREMGGSDCGILTGILNALYNSDLNSFKATMASVPDLRAKPEAESLCNCGNSTYSTNMMEWMASTTDSRREFLFRALFHYFKYNESYLLPNIMGNLGHSGYADDNDAVDYMMNYYGGTDADIALELENAGFTACDPKTIELMSMVYSLLPVDLYTTMITAYPNYNDILLSTSSTSSCSITKPYTCLSNVADIVSDANVLYDYPTADVLWNAIWAVDQDYNAQLNDFWSMDPVAFMREYSKVNIAGVSAFQQSTSTLYSTTGNGMEAYFARIKDVPYSGASLFNSLMAYFGDVSSTYTDTLKVKEWMLYGSSRLGTKVSDKRLLSSKFTALYNTTKFTNITEVVVAAADANPEIILATRGEKQFELSNHLGNVLAVVSDKKRVNTPAILMNETFTTPFTFNPSGYNLPNSWNVQNTIVTFSSGTLKIEDDPLFASATPRVHYFFPINSKPKNGRTYRVTIKVAKVKTGAAGSWLMRMTCNTNIDQALTTGTNIFTFTAVGDVSKLGWYYSTANQDLEYTFDDLKIEDITTAGTKVNYDAVVLQATNYSAFGAPLPGAFTLGKEQTFATLSNQFNGTTTETEGWTGLNSTTLTIDNGRLKFVGTLSTSLAQKQNILIKNNQAYELILDVDLGDYTGVQVNILDNNGSTANTASVITSSGRHVISFKGASNMLLVKLTPQGGGGSSKTGYFNYVVIKEATTAPLNNQFISGVDGWTGYYSTTLTNDNERMKFTGLLNYSVAQKTNIAVKVNQEYELTLDVDLGTYTGVNVNIGDNNGAVVNTVYILNTSGKHTINFKTASTSLLINLTPLGGGGGSKTCYFSSVILREALKKGSSDYAFGFNGQEQDDEIAGEGNINAALYWEYDTRLGRRWNIDPQQNPSLSGYSCFGNNPVYYVDFLGDIFSPSSQAAKNDFVNETNKNISTAQSNIAQLDKKINKLNNKISAGKNVANNTKKLAELTGYKNNWNDKLGQYKAALSEVNAMEANPNVVFNLIDANGKGPSTMPGNNSNEIDIRFNNNSELSHELNHGYQGMMGTTSFDPTGGGEAGILHDIYDEQEAVQRQWAYGGIQATSMSAITPAFLKSNYPQYANTPDPGFNLTVKTSTLDVQQAHIRTNTHHRFPSLSGISKSDLKKPFGDYVKSNPSITKIYGK